MKRTVFIGSSIGAGGGLKSKLALAVLSLAGLVVIILLLAFAAVAAAVIIPVGLILILPKLFSGKPKKADDGIIDAEFTELPEEEQSAIESKKEE
ncbi:MAG: hypothetical protein WCI43_07070 [Candidatus Firestonebacteria bacterium]